MFLKLILYLCLCIGISFTYTCQEINNKFSNFDNFSCREEEGKVTVM